MLKHCHATSFDQNRRSRRNLTYSQNIGLVEGNESIKDASSNGNEPQSEGITNTHNASFQCSTPVSSNGLTASTSFLTLNSITQQKYSSLQRDDSRRSSYSTLEPLSITSRTSSFASLNNVGGQDNSMKRTPIKIYAKCLRSDIEYKTLSISRHTTSTEVIWMLLSKFKMRHRDPKLFYLTMDIGIISHGCSSSGNRVGHDDSFTRTLVLEDDAYPAELKSCHPWGECRFTLQTRKGGLVRIHDSVLMEESKYKCLLISDMTTVNEVISILFHCYGLERIERVDRYELWEQSQQPVSGYERCLQASDCPVIVQSSWQIPSQYKFVLRRATAAYKTNTPLSTNSSSLSVTTSTSSLASPRSSSVSPCSSTSTTENMSISLSPSSTNESDVNSANDSDIIEEVDEDAMDTSYNNPYSPLSIHSMVRSSPSGASSSSSSCSPSGNHALTNIYSPQKHIYTENVLSNTSKTQLPVLQPRASQYSFPVSLPPHHNGANQGNLRGNVAATPAQSTAQVCFDKSPNFTNKTQNNMPFSQNLRPQNGILQNNTQQTIQEQHQMNQKSWKIPNTTNIKASQGAIGQHHNICLGDTFNQDMPKPPKTNFNLNGPVSKLYSDIRKSEDRSIYGQRQMKHQHCPPSIHESGLPSLQPKPSPTYSSNSIQMQARFSSLNFRNNNSNYQKCADQRNNCEGSYPYPSLNGVNIKNNHIAFHEYENYFYI